MSGALQGPSAPSGAVKCAKFSVHLHVTAGQATCNVMPWNYSSDGQGQPSSASKKCRKTIDQAFRS